MYLTGTFVDCLGGQWWAHSLDLGYLLPQEHVQSTVSSVFAGNHTDSFNPGVIWVANKYIVLYVCIFSQLINTLVNFLTKEMLVYILVAGQMEKCHPMPCFTHLKLVCIYVCMFMVILTSGCLDWLGVSICRACFIWRTEWHSTERHDYNVVYNYIIYWAVVLLDARNKYDGTRRSPWNEVECGDHYTRPMAGFLLFEIASGQVVQIIITNHSVKLPCYIL